MFDVGYCQHNLSILGHTRKLWFLIWAKLNGREQWDEHYFVWPTCSSQTADINMSRNLWKYKSEVIFISMFIPLVIILSQTFQFVLPVAVAVAQSQLHIHYIEYSAMSNCASREVQTGLVREGLKKSDGPAMQNVRRTTLNVCQGPKGGLMCPPGPQWPPRPIFRARKFYVIVKQTDTGVLFSGHWQVSLCQKLKFLLGDFWVFR